MLGDREEGAVPALLQRGRLALAPRTRAACTLLEGKNTTKYFFESSPAAPRAVAAADSDDDDDDDDERDGVVFGVCVLLERNRIVRRAPKRGDCAGSCLARRQDASALRRDRRSSQDSRGAAREFLEAWCRERRAFERRVFSSRAHTERERARARERESGLARVE